MPGQVIRCFSRDVAPTGGIYGRVTDGLKTIEFDPETTEFYVCGSSAMAADCKTLLEQRGALHVFIGSY
jgi:NAD(P)H-flavin reductase